MGTEVVGENMDLYILDIRNIDVDTCMGRVCENRKEKASRLRFVDDKKRSLGSELLRDYVIDQYIKKYYPESISVTPKHYYLPNGKPQAEVGHVKVEYNISHSGNYVVAVIGDRCCGVDIEQIRKPSSSVVNRCFDGHEQSAMKNSTNKDRTFTAIWTMKESYLKMTGDGIRKGLNEVNTCYNEKNYIYRLPNGVNYRLFDYDDYVITVCFTNDNESGESDITVAEVALEKIVKE